MIEGFLSSAKAYPANNALWVDGSFITYQELKNSASSIAATISRFKKPAFPGQCAVFASRTKTAYAAVLGAQMSSMAYIPMSPSFQDSQNLQILDEIEAVDSSTIATLSLIWLFILLIFAVICSITVTLSVTF